MALEITHLVKETDDEHVEATERLCLTEDRERLVPESDLEARWLFCIPGTRITKADAERYGLLKAKPKPADKAVKAPEGDKAQPDATAVREWAEAQGIEVSPRGRIPASVLDAYLQAHPES